MSLSKLQLEKYKKGWIKSFCNNFSQDENGYPLPWMTYPFIEFISDKLDSNHRIFEFGFGASTLFFAQKVKEVIAIESNLMWLKAMIIELEKIRESSSLNYKINSNYSKNIEEFIAKFSFLSIKNKPKDFLLLKSSSNYSFSGNIEIIMMEDALINPNYEKFISNYKEKFDFIFIDSIKRFECARNSILSLKKDGMLILDDSQRKGYKKIFDFFEENGFKKQDFVGIAPGQLKLKNTTVFTKNY